LTGATSRRCDWPSRYREYTENGDPIGSARASGRIRATLPPAFG
jgi:hypothetical protein